MRRLFAVLSLFALFVLVAAVAVCGVVGLAEAPVEAGLTLAEVAPEFAECPLGAAALDAEYRTATELRGARCSLDQAAHMAIPTDDTRTTDYKIAGDSERLKRPSMGPARAAPARGTHTRNPEVRGPGVHAARG